jgi:hypothetical protein
VTADVSAILDEESVLVWREQWLEERARLAVARERWGDDDWNAVRRAADVAWDTHPVGLYIYAAEEACRRRNWDRVEARLAFEAAHGVEWLRGVLERTA